MKGEPSRPKIADSEHEGDDEGEGAVGRVALGHHHQRRGQGQRREHIEEDGVDEGDRLTTAPPDDGRGHEDVQGMATRHQHLPAEVHELVVAEAGHACPAAR